MVMCTDSIQMGVWHFFFFFFDPRCVALTQDIFAQII